MTSIQTEIESAVNSGNRLMEIYAQLRSRVGTSERTNLLRQAHEEAETIGIYLQRIATGKDEIKDNAETSEALRVLGELVELVMVQEREYRLASGDAPDCEEEVSL